MRDQARPDPALTPPTPVRSGARRIDRYEIGEVIGSGGMGTVYRAVDTKLGRTVALKTATSKRTGARLTDRVRQRFLREAMALSRVEHRNVVQVLDFGFADDGTPFLVMEHLRGHDLGARLAAAASPLSVVEVADVMLGVCAALRACHRVGIIHRDLKPGNIFLCETDTGRQVKVLDFGVSKAPAADDLTREGQILGTPQYLAPEQVDGKVGPASDQYALGVLLYVCLTLRLPYQDHQDRGLLRAIEAGRFTPPRQLRPELSPELEAIVLRAMQVAPGDRFQSVFELGQQLWSLASARGREEWRGYYFPARACPAGLPDATLTSTQILEGSEGDGAENPALSRENATRSSTEPLGARPTPADPLAVESAWRTPGEMLRPRLGRLGRLGRRLAIVAAAGVLLALTLVAGRARLRRARRTAVEVAGRPMVGVLTTPSPAPPPTRARPRSSGAQPPVRAPASDATEAPAHPATTTSALSPTDPPEEEPPAPHRHRLRRAPSANPGAPTTFSRALPNIDGTGIGIPTE